MSWRALSLLLCAALLALLLDMAGPWQAPRPHASPPAGTLLLPQLSAAQADVTAVQLQPPGGTALTLQREADGWRVLPVGMAADAALVQSWLERLARARIVAGRTGDPARYGVLGVADPGEQGAGTVVRLAGGRQPWPALVFGHYAPRLDGTFVRIAGSPRSLLVEGDLAPPVRTVDWLHHPLLSLPPSAVLQVDLVGPGGARYMVDRSLDGRPRVLAASRGLRQPLAAGELLLSLLDGLDFDGVQRPLPAPAQALRMRALLSDGSLLTLTAWQDKAGGALGNLSIQPPEGGLPPDAAAGLAQTAERVRAHTWQLMPATWALLQGALYPQDGLPAAGSVAPAARVSPPPPAGVAGRPGTGTQP